MDIASGSRLLIRRLHGIMAGPGTAEERLNRIVGEIAKNMVAEVCSVYFMAGDGVLELFATEGLKREAVHKSRLKVGEGLVGHIAETGMPLNLPEATEHPKFVYLPETGEERYHSLMGVPIIRAGEVVGVLVVQNQTPRHYDNEEIEALQTVAMVLAELLDALESVDSIDGEDGRDNASVTLQGQNLVQGLGAGAAFFHEPKLEITHHLAEDTAAERTRLESGLEKLRRDLDRTMAASDIAVVGEYREILDTYRMFADDRGWQRRIREAIDTGFTAEAAVERIQQDIRTQMARTEDEYLRERLSDLEDLSNRLIRTLLGFSGREAHHNLVEDVIVVARNMGPAELLDYDRSHLKGIVLEEGSPTSHVTIVARGLGIPMLGRVGGILSGAREGDRVIVDAEAGRAILRPGEDIRETYEESLSVRAALLKEYEAERELPTVTRDGVKIALLMNAGLLIDLPNLAATGAAGIGLFRTEFQFMVSATLPRIPAQTRLYQRVMNECRGKPVVFRTLDIGGDKRVPYLTHEDEENPALGWRAIRLALGRPALLRYQLRALLKASAGETLRLMFPMIAEVAEFIAAKRFVEAEKERMVKLGEEGPSEILVGAMFEVPALAWQIERLLDVADFISIGTNDLMQFLFASDRSNPRLTDRYDLISPPVLNLISTVVAAAGRKSVPVTLCGELGKGPIEALAFLGVGLTSLSLTPTAIGPVRRVVRNVDVGELQAWLTPILDSGKHSIRDDLKAYAKERDIPV